MVFCTSILLLNEYFENEEADFNKVFYRIQRFLPSAFFSAYKVPFLFAASALISIVIDTIDQWFLQRTVATGDYCELNTGRFDVVMVEADTSKTLTKSKNRKMHLRFAKNPSFEKTVRTQRSNVRNKSNNRQHCLECKPFGT